MFTSLNPKENTVFPVRKKKKYRRKCFQYMDKYCFVLFFCILNTLNKIMIIMII